MKTFLKLWLGLAFGLLCVTPTHSAQAAAKAANHNATPDVKPVAPPGAAKPDAAAAPPAEEPAPSGPAAHFAALRADKVNLHTGPGDEYPISWQYVRRGLPVEVLTVFDIWRKIRDVDGTEGWVNQVMLTGRRSVLITGGTRSLRHNPVADAEVVAELEAGVIAKLAHCDPVWCQVETHSYNGWLKRDEVWGLEPGEVVQ